MMRPSRFLAGFVGYHPPTSAFAEGGTRFRGNKHHKMSNYQEFQRSGIQTHPMSGYACSSHIHIPNSHVHANPMELDVLSSELELVATHGDPVVANHPCEHLAPYTIRGQLLGARDSPEAAEETAQWVDWVDVLGDLGNLGRDMEEKMKTRHDPWDCHRTAAPDRPPLAPPLAVSRQSGSPMGRTGGPSD